KNDIIYDFNADIDFDDILKWYELCFKLNFDIIDINNENKKEKEQQIFGLRIWLAVQCVEGDIFTYCKQNTKTHILIIKGILKLLCYSPHLWNLCRICQRV